MRILGIDLGSRYVKIVSYKDKTLEHKKLIDTPLFYREFCEYENGRLAINKETIDLETYDKVIATGYGRNNLKVDGADIIVELKAHLLGVVFQTELENFTLLDVGGQDSKVILVKNKKMVDLMLNDKCAASCGRYLENMANVLGIGLDKLCEYSEKPEIINSTCAVFSESELIGRISSGVSIDRLASGVNYSLFKRIRPNLEKMYSDVLVATGGVANNKSFIGFIEREMSFKKIIIPDDPVFNGAIGCVAYALE